MHTTHKEKFIHAFEKESNSIFGFLYARLGDRERALELTQDTFMRTWIYLAQGKPIISMRPFLFTIAYNLFKNELRSKRETFSLEKMAEAYDFEPSSIGKNQEEQLEEQMLISKIDKLPLRYQEVLRLRYVYGLPVKNIATKLGESASTISVRIHRGIGKLREEYHEKFT